MAKNPVTKPQPSYPAGQGIVRPAPSIATQIEKEQRRQSNGSDPSRK